MAYKQLDLFTWQELANAPTEKQKLAKKVALALLIGSLEGLGNNDDSDEEEEVLW